MGHVAGLCSRNTLQGHIAELAHLWKISGTCFRDMLQRHVLSCALALFHSRNMKFVQNLPLQHVARSSTCWTSWDMLQGQILHKCSPATCPVSVYLTRFSPRYILQQHVPATCPLVWAHLKKCLKLRPPMTPGRCWTWTTLVVGERSHHCAIPIQTR